MGKAETQRYFRRIPGGDSLISRTMKGIGGNGKVK